MNGILNILKPPGVTSFDMVAWLRRTLKTKKVGHTGTLDPDAVGVLPICLGKATRLVEYMMDDHKFYRGQITLGIETDTQDSRGEITARHNFENLEITHVERVLADFIGDIQQVPPMVSAVKHKGKRLYELAREGKEVSRDPRLVTVYSLKMLKANLPKIWIDVECSKGTYIRTLAHDIGQVLGCGAHLSYLIRMKTGEFNLVDSFTLEEIEVCLKNGRISDILKPIDWGIRSLPQAIINNKAVKKAVNGASLEKGDYLKYPGTSALGQLVRVYQGDNFISLSKVTDLDSQTLHPIKVFA